MVINITEILVRNVTNPNATNHLMNTCQYSGAQEVVLGRAAIIIVINAFWIGYLAILKKWCEKDWETRQHHWNDKSDWGIIPLIITAIWLLQVAIMGF